MPDGNLRDEPRSEIAYLRQTLDAEIEVRRRANHLVAGMIDERRNLMRQLAAEIEHSRFTDETPTFEDVSTTQTTPSESAAQPPAATAESTGCGVW